MSSAPIRTIGSGSLSPVRARSKVNGETRDASPVSALARANAGALLSAATAASSVAASGWSAHAAWNAAA
jgi:hypothetical protein